MRVAQGHVLGFLEIPRESQDCQLTLLHLQRVLLGKDELVGGTPGPFEVIDVARAKVLHALRHRIDLLVLRLEPA